MQPSGVHCYFIFIFHGIVFWCKIVHSFVIQFVIEDYLEKWRAFRPERAFHRSRPHSDKILSDKVLILVLVEDGLRDALKV